MGIHSDPWSGYQKQTTRALFHLIMKKTRAKLKWVSENGMGDKDIGERTEANRAKSSHRDLVLGWV